MLPVRAIAWKKGEPAGAGILDLIGSYSMPISANHITAPFHTQRYSRRLHEASSAPGLKPVWIES